MRRLKPMTADECAEFLRALSDPTRLKIIALLFEREWSVTELAHRLG
jgi:DNA-binding transcriptional ArsR family regulator